MKVPITLIRYINITKYENLIFYFIECFKNYYFSQCIFTSIESLDGIKNMKNLKTLFARNNKISDLKAISELKHLIDVNLDDNQISDLSPLKTAIQIETLWL